MQKGGREMSENKPQKAKCRYNLDGDIFSARPLKRSYDSSVQMCLDF